MSDWTPSTFEDELLAVYHDQIGGRTYTEVATPWSGGYKEWKDGYRNRYIDAVRLAKSDTDVITPFANHGTEVLDAVENAHVELIEIKKRLNRPLIGQILAGDDLLQADYAPASVHRVALCRDTDPGLEWVCDQRDITVECFDPAEYSP